MRRLSASVLIVLALHAALGWGLLHERPHLGILPPLPTPETVDALAMGDHQFLYRSLVLQIQNAGDTGGRFTPMKNYDIGAVIDWMAVLQRLDHLSSHYTFLLLRYFSLGADADKLKALIRFIDADVDLAPDRKWYWQTQIVAKARGELKDLSLALELSRKMRAYVPYLPEGYTWVLQTEPVLLADLGRLDEARIMMEEILQKHGDHMTPAERQWTQEFLSRL